MDLKVLMDQHAELSVIVGKLNSLLDQRILTNRAAEVEECISRLSDELTAHLATEDKYLYPILMRCDDSEIVETAKNFSTNMGGLKDTFIAYREKWKVEEIASDPTNFILETIELISFLTERVSKEEKILFPLAGQL